MHSSTVLLLAADLVLLLHTAFVAYIVGGLLLIGLGQRLGWGWVRNPWFRWTHLLGIGVVIVQSWLQLLCPLTTLEMALRTRAGESAYAGAFIAHWLESILYYHAPAWVFTTGYTLFGVGVAVCWWLVPPRRYQPHRPRCTAPRV